MDPIQSDMLICPQCKGALQPGPEGSERLDCQNCPLSYPLRDGVPVLVIKQASARKIETDDEFERLISEALQAPFSGWDFSWLGRFDGCLAHQQHPRHYVMLGWSSAGMHHRLQSPALLLTQSHGIAVVRGSHI